jgi:hypothetical protein
MDPVRKKKNAQGKAAGRLLTEAADVMVWDHPLYFPFTFFFLPFCIYYSIFFFKK